MKNKSWVVSLAMIWLVFISFPMEKEEVSIVAGASYCSLHFRNAKTIMLFCTSDNHVVLASKESIEEIFGSNMKTTICFRNRHRKELWRNFKDFKDISEIRALKQELASRLDPEATLPEFLSSSELLFEKNAVILRLRNTPS